MISSEQILLNEKLIASIKKNDIDAMSDLLFKGAEIHGQALVLGCNQKTPDVIKWFITYNVSIDTLLAFCITEKNLALIRYCIENGANINNTGLAEESIGKEDKKAWLFAKDYKNAISLKNKMDNSLIKNKINNNKLKI